MFFSFLSCTTSMLDIFVLSKPSNFGFIQWHQKICDLLLQTFIWIIWTKELWRILQDIIQQGFVIETLLLHTHSKLNNGCKEEKRESIERTVQYKKKKILEWKCIIRLVISFLFCTNQFVSCMDTNELILIRVYMAKDQGSAKRVMLCALTFLSIGGKRWYLLFC